MERHILQRMLQGHYIEIDKKDFPLFPYKFVKQYQLLREMKTKGVELSKVNFGIYADMERIEVDLDYPKLNDKIKDESIEKSLKVYLTKRKVESIIEEGQSHLQSYKETGNEYFYNLYKETMRKIPNQDNKQPLKTLEVAREEQLEFMKDLFEGKEVDAIHLYRKGGSKQFLRLNYLFKYIGKEDLIVIGGTPSVGKTSFVLSLMNVLSKNGYKSLFFSLEQTASQIIHRLGIAKAGVNHNDLFDLSGVGEDLRQRYEKGLKDISKLPITIADNPFNSWLDMKETIIENKDNIDYIVIDHLTYIRSYDGTPNNSNHSMYSQIVRDIKDTAKELKKPIILLAQFNRGVGGSSKGKKTSSRYKEPYMDDFRETGSIEEYADKILLLYRKEDDNEKYNIFRTVAKVDKNRAGALGKIEYLFTASNNRWRELKRGDDSDE